MQRDDRKGKQTAGKKLAVSRAKSGDSQTARIPKGGALGTGQNGSKGRVIRVLHDKPDTKDRDAVPKDDPAPADTRSAPAPALNGGIHSDIENKGRPAKRGRLVAENPRVTLYLDPQIKALLDATGSVLKAPVYKLLTEAFKQYLAQLPEADRELIEKLARRRSE